MLHLPSTFGGSFGPLVILIALSSLEKSQEWEEGQTGPSEMPLETQAHRLRLTLVLSVFS